MLKKFRNKLEKAINEFGSQLMLNYAITLGVLLGPATIMGIILHFIEKQTLTNFAKSIGWKGILFTAWIGTPVHELGHAIFCIIFRHKITDLSLFSPSEASGTLGYVEHTFRKNSLYQNLGTFFIGIAPLISGSLSIYMLLYWLLPEGKEVLLSLAKTLNNLAEIKAISLSNVSTILFTGLSDSLRLIFLQENFTNYKFYIFIYLSLCIGSHIAPSKPDLQGSVKGFVILLVLILIAVAAAILIGLNLTGFFSSFKGAFLFLNAILLLSIIISGLNLILTYIFLKLFSIIIKR